MVGQGAASGDFLRATLVLTGSTTLIIIGTWLILKYMPRRRAFGGLALQTSLVSGSGLEEPPAGEGHVKVDSSSVTYTLMVGSRGTALTDLRPSGVARIGNHRIDVVTEGDFIEEGKTIEVIADEEYRRVVKMVDETEAKPIEENTP